MRLNTGSVLHSTYDVLVLNGLMYKNKLLNTKPITSRFRIGILFHIQNLEVLIKLNALKPLLFGI